MSKLADKLRAMKIRNNHELLLRFGGPKDVAVYYHKAVFMAECNKTQVYSPRFPTNPNAAWHDNGQKTFVGSRANSTPLALEWASKEYGITEWVTSPFGGKIPKHVLEAAKKAK